MTTEKRHPILEYNEREAAKARDMAEERLRRAIMRHLDRIKVDGNGHCISPRILHQVGKIRFASTKPGWNTSVDELDTLADALTSGVFPLAATHSIAIDLGFDSRCYFCGLGHGDTAPPLYRLDGETLRATSPCATEEGPFTVKLAVPSGILAIGNDFRRHGKPDPEARKAEVQAFAEESLPARRLSAALGARRGAMTLVMAEDAGGIYRRQDGTILVGQGSALHETEMSIPEAEGLGGYWRAFADGDDIPMSANGVARVPVEPGMYAFTIHGLGLDRAAFDTDEWHHPAVEIEIRRVPDP